MSERLDTIDPSEFTRQLARITQPALVVAAASSPPVFRRMTDRLTAALPNARQVVVEFIRVGND